MNKLNALVEELTGVLQRTYEEGVTMDEAEKLAAKFLYAQLLVSAELAAKDLDARMKKSGTKAVKAAVYMAEATKGDKKPSDTMLQAHVDLSKEVADQQDLLDSAEIERDRLQATFNILKEGHIYFRSVSRGRFE